MRALPIARHGGPVRGPALPHAARPVAWFVLHLLEMCVAMCLGGIVLSALVFGAAALLGYPDLRQTSPVLSTLVVTADLAVAMTVWMRFRGMAWRPTIEMAGSTVLVGVLTVAGYRLGVTPDALMVQGVCGTACVVMLPVMLLRFRMYAEPPGHHHPGRR